MPGFAEHLPVHDDDSIGTNHESRWFARCYRERLRAREPLCVRSRKFTRQEGFVDVSRVNLVRDSYEIEEISPARRR